MNLKQMFEKTRKKETTRVIDTKKAFNSFSNNNFINFKPGNTYKFRLLPLLNINELTINQQKHTFYDKSTSVYKEVVCPTSEYMEGEVFSAFKSCPICVEAKKFYKDAKESQSAKELYNTFKRKFNGYAMVYVVNDPTNEENNGTIKIIRYGIGIADELSLKILGVNRKDKEVVESNGDDSIIGIEAFKLDGYDLIITVTLNKTEDRDYNKYSCDFSRKKSVIDVTEDDIKKAFDELEMSKYYKKSTQQELDEFYSTCVLHEEIQDEVDKDDIETFEEEEEVTSNYEEVTTDISEDDDSEKDEDDEIDDLLKGLDDDEDDIPM